MTASSNGEGAEQGPHQPGTPNSDISTASDLRRLGLGTRASSPAKRTRAERDGEGGMHEDMMREMEVDGNTSGPHSPKKSGGLAQHVSPMPSRTRPPAPRSAHVSTTDVVMTSEGADHSESNTEANTGSTPPTSNDAESEAASSGSPTDRPSYDEQYRIVRQLVDEDVPEEGKMSYIVPSSWIGRVISRTTQGLNEGHPKHLREGEVGPVNTTELVLDAAHLRNTKDGNGNEVVSLKPGLTLHDDFIIVPPQAWKLIMQWYGLDSGSPIITRYAHKTEGSNVQYELYPLLFKVQKLRHGPADRGLDSIGDDDKRAGIVVASRSELYQQFLKRAKSAVGISMTCKVRVWKVIEALAAENIRSGMPTPMSSRDPSPAPSSLLPSRCIDLDSLNALEEGTQRELVEQKDETANEKYNGTFKLGLVGFMDTQTIILEEQVREGDEWRSEKHRKAAPSDAKSSMLTVPGTSKAKNASASGRQSPAPTAMMTRGRSKKGRTKGTVGLQNLGNTCYMNSALQCIRAVQELTIYFLSDEYKKDLNTDNPLGYHGSIARSYASLVSSIYETDSSFSPRSFKAALGKAQPLFSGYGQQDSQEFLSFLIDGLHEDLNRIHKKPYLENPDSDDKTVRDPEAIRQLGETYRSNHRARNNSVAMDLFSGFYKNTMVCPVCDKVSVTFDPYAQVTLQLPIDTPFQHQITYSPLYGPPVVMDVDIDKNSSIKQLKEYIAKRVPGQVSGGRIIVAEEYSEKLYKVFEDAEVIAEANIQSADHILAFELDEAPTNWPPKVRKAKYYTSSYFSRTREDVEMSMESPQAEVMAVPIVHRIPEKTRHVFKLWPSFIVITRNEAKDEDAILRKVLAKVQTMTTRSLVGPSSNQESSDNMLTGDGDDHEANNMQTSTHSSDTSFVDVQMSEGHGEPGRTSSLSTSTASTLAISAARAKSVLDPNNHLSDQLRSLFTVCTYRVSGEMVPTGYTSLNERDTYPSLASKLPEKTKSKKARSNHAVRTDAESDDSEDELSKPSNWQNRTNDTSSSASTSGDDMFSHNEQDSASDLGKDDTAQEASAREADLTERPFLISLGDGLVLDWDLEGYSQLFEGSGGDDWRGQRTDAEKPVIEDAELTARRAKRNTRKKSGVTLDECFAETAKSEVLSEDNAWYCNRCKELRRATKTLELWTVPDILVVHLKRFSSGSRLRDKIEILVDAPTTNLNLDGRVGLPEGKSLTYDLFAVDNHYGGLGGGHYTAYTKNFFDGKWYDYNDSFVSQVSEDSVVSKAAYLLFYRRRSDRVLGPDYLQDLVTEAMSPDSQSGEDQRQDDSSSLNGSSTRSRGAEASHLSRQSQEHSNDRARGATGSAGLANPAKSALNKSRSLDAPLPPNDTDEGYDSGAGHASDSDPDDPLPSLEDVGSTPYNGSFVGPMQYGDWSFANVPNNPTNSNAGSDANMADDGSDTLNDGDSNAPNAGSEAVGEDLADRMHTDFGDDEENPVTFNHGDQIQLESDVEEPPTAVIEVEEDSTGTA